LKKVLIWNLSDDGKQEGREEFSDWPDGLLAIGTFGNNKEAKEKCITTKEEPSSSEQIPDFTPEEIGKLQKELTKLLRQKPKVEKEIAHLPLDRFLNCPSSLEVDRRISNVLCSDSENKDDEEEVGKQEREEEEEDDDDDGDDEEEDIEKTLGVILGRFKEICAKNSKKAIGKKSISFLLKKMFVCRSGFAPTPSLRDTLQLQESRMEKVGSPFGSVGLHVCALHELCEYNVAFSYEAFEDDSSQENKLPAFFSGTVSEEATGGQEEDADGGGSRG